MKERQREREKGRERRERERERERRAGEGEGEKEGCVEGREMVEREMGENVWEKGRGRKGGK